MSRAWNCGGPVGYAGGEAGQRIRKTFDGGIVLESQPRKGFEGYWVSLNGRVSVRKKNTSTRGTAWSVYVDGKLIGNNELANLKECVTANAWAIQKAAQ